MKTELTDVSDTQKTIRFEIPPDVVEAEIDRIARTYMRRARIPGFRPGKVPASVIKQRFRHEILHDVINDLIPKAVDEALQERGIEPVDAPDVRDVDVREGQPLTFTAAVETVPPIDPGDLTAITLREVPSEVSEAAIDQAIERLRHRAATFEPVEGRPAAEGDSVVVDLERKAGDEVERHEAITVEIGSPANPPDFDANLTGLTAGETKSFTVRFPDSYPAAELAGTEVGYTVTLREIRRKVLPELDDEFAKDLGQFDSLEALRERVRADLQAEADEAARRQLRSDLLKQLAERVTFRVPAALVEREMDRRMEEFVRQLVAQGIDPREAGIDWAQFRESQRESAQTSVASALVLDEIARRENLTVSAEDVDKEIEEYASRAGRTPAAVRAQFEKEGGLGRLTGGLRRERAIDFALSRAKMTAG